MTELLQKAIAQIQQLPPDRQDAIRIRVASRRELALPLALACRQA